MNNRQLSFTFVTAELFQRLGRKQTNKYYNKRCSYYSLTQKTTRGFRSSVPGTRGKDQIPNMYFLLCHNYHACRLLWQISSQESTCYVEDLGSIPGSGRSSEEGNGKPVQYSCLVKPIDRGAWWAAVHGVAKSQTEQLRAHSQPVYQCSLPTAVSHKLSLVFVSVYENCDMLTFWLSRGVKSNLRSFHSYQLNRDEEKNLVRNQGKKYTLHTWIQ